MELRKFVNEKLGIEISPLFVDKEGLVWFPGKAAAISLGYSDPNQALRKHTDEDEKIVLDYDFLSPEAQEIRDCVESTQSNIRSVLWANPADKRPKTIINEYGLYRLAIESGLPNAGEFKRWIIHEVIPSVQKNGAYVYGQENLQDKEFEKLRKKEQKLERKVRTLTAKAERCERIAEKWHKSVALNAVKDIRIRDIKAKLKKLEKYLNDAEDRYARIIDENSMLYRRIAYLEGDHRQTVSPYDIAPDGTIIR